jgi:hypothetical protein
VLSFLYGAPEGARLNGSIVTSQTIDIKTPDGLCDSSLFASTLKVA